jgi:hypothetical protein
MGLNSKYEVKKISASELNLFNQCPLRWKFREDKTPTTPVDRTAADYGGEIHKIVAYYFDKLKIGGNLNDIEGMIDEAFDCGNDLILKGDTSKTKKIRKNLLSFEIDRFKKNGSLSKPHLIEKRFELKINPSIPLIVGIIDCYDSKTETIIDWKTGNNDYFSDSFLTQGKIYETLIKAQNLPVKKVLFVNLNCGTTHQMPKVTDAWLMNQIKQMCDNVEQNRFTKKPSKLCDWCEYRLTCEMGGGNLWEIPFIVKDVDGL